MKLRKLTIHNLASIEDAVIDFANGPLSESSIFLICGETGSGKSTLLDAICLALYKDTPRMRRTNRESYQDQAITSLDNVQTNDCRQLVRRNAKEAWVELELADNDEQLYTARWSVDRARTGNLKKAEWSLHNHQSDETLHKDAEIEAEIHRIIGLDFEQFCRTTLLAQGEFTRFLQSNAHEKADILERLTNTDIYSQIGIRIFESWKQHKSAYEMQKLKLDAIRLLTEEEKKTYQDSIVQKEAGIQALGVQIEQLHHKLQWLTSEQLLNQKISEAQQAFEQAQSILKSDAFKEAEKLLFEWNLSTEARPCYREGQRLQQQIDSEEQEIKALQDKIRQLHPSHPADASQVLPLLQKEEKSIQAICLEMKQILEREQQESVLQEQNLKALAIENQELRKEKIQQEIELFRALQSKQSLWEEKKKTQQETEEEISSLQTHILELNKQTEQWQTELKQATQSRQIQEQVVGKLKEATENWAKEARHKLKLGDSCPVCGHIIDQILSDESFHSKLEGPEKELDQLKKTEEDIRNRFNQSVAEEKTYAQTLHQTRLKKEEITRSCNRLKQELDESCQNLQLPHIDAAELETRIHQHKEEIETINQTLKAGKELTNQLSAIQKKIQQTQQEWSKHHDKLHACQLRMGTYQTLNEQRTNLEKHQKDTSNELDILQQKLKAFLMQHPELSPERLYKLASYPEEKVENMRQRMQQTREDIVKKETTLQNLQKEKEAHQVQKPAFDAEETLQKLTEKQSQLESQNNLYHQEIGQIRQTLVANQQALQQQEKELLQQQELYQVYQKWTRLKELFGSADGKTFRAIAQSFILKELLQNTNYYLKHFTDRYQLEGQGISLTILLRDYYEGGVTRPVSTLSGGESFLISLALALGLSSLNQQQLSVDTLFIDEGFGTLSSDYLNTVMDTLEKLHQLGGKRVGIISHVEGLRERIRTQIQVNRLDNSRSEVIIQ